MEDQVPFKVFVYWTEDGKPEVRRFGVDKTVVTSFHYVNAKLQDVYPGLKGRTYKVSWKDEDEDDITISSDEEVMTALTALHGNLVKLYVHVTDGEDKDDDCDPPVAEIQINPGGVDLTHYTVTCDGCNSAVVGFRYKCTICYDFDLCSKCESAGLHPEHCMVRLPSPIMPRNLIKAALKRSRHFLKTVASAPEANKRHRRDKSGERRRDLPHGFRHHFDEKRCGRPRTSWLDTFTSYMNEFANLAGDIGIEKPDQQPTEEQKKQDEHPKRSTENTQAPPQSEPTTNPTPDVHPFMPGMENIPKLIEMYFNGTLASYLQNAASNANPTPQAEDNGASTSAAQAAATASSNPQPRPSNEDVEMGDGAPKQDATKPVKTELASGTVDDASRDASPDKVEGWTMINKEKDLQDTSDNSGESASGPIGFNLPEEFQERVRIGDGQNLYPPLNLTTAVLNPKEPSLPVPPLVPVQAPMPTQAPAAPKAPTAAQAPTAPQAPFAPQPPFAFPQPQPRPAPQHQPPRPSPQPQRPLHPLAHIDAAIRQMLAMGFTNEDGWLTKLLENKDGNIAAVLDLLTPPRQ